MSASLIARASAVTPAATRRRVRERQLRGPVARPQRLLGPAGRPQQPALAGLRGRPVELRNAPATAPAGAGVQLTDRGIAVVVVLLGLILAATVAVGVVKFFGVSNAPLDRPAQAEAGLVLQG